MVNLTDNNNLNFSTNFFNFESEELNNLIAALSIEDPHTSTLTLADLAEKIRQNSRLPSIKPIQKYITFLAHDLIFKQFREPAPEAIREMISNSLDAQVRGKREKEPIRVKLQGNTLEIEDRGDGMNASGLINFFVPGRSSNHEAIFDLEKGIPKVTGRYGQGGFAPFFFLLYHLVSKFADTPQIIVKDNVAKIELICQIKGIHQKLIFQIVEVTPKYYLSNFQFELLPTSPPEQKVIHIHTFKEGFSPLKIDFQEINGRILVDARESTKEKPGTSFSITSPLIEKEGKTIANFIRSTFLFVSSSPIYLNDELLNDLSQFRTIEFEGGEIYFDSEIAMNNDEEGLLYICEGGKRITTCYLNDSKFYKKVCLNFQQLKLSQDRSTIDHNDQTFTKPLGKLIQKLKAFDWEVKAQLYNSLAPVIESNGDFLNLIKEDVTSLCRQDMKKAIDLFNPIYIDLKKFKYLKSQFNWRVLINNNQTDPLICFEKDDEYFIILSGKIADESDKDILLLNSIVIEIFVKNKYPGAKDFSISSLSSQESFAPPLTIDEPQDVSFYENMSGANDLFLSHPEDRNFKDFEIFYKAIRDKKISRKFAYFLKDWWEKSRDLVNDTFRTFMIDVLARCAQLENKMTLPNYASFVNNTLKLYLTLPQSQYDRKNQQDDQYVFRDFCFNEFIQSLIYKQPFSYQPIYDAYLQVREIIKAFDYPAYHLQTNFLHRFKNDSDTYLKLARKCHTEFERKKLFYHLSEMLNDPAELEKLTDDSMHFLLSCLPSYDESRESDMELYFLALGKADYPLLSKHLFSKNYTDSYKKKIFLAYAYAVSIYFGLPPYREEVLNYFIRLSSTWSHDDIENKGSRVVTNLKNLCELHKTEYYDLSVMRYVDGKDCPDATNDTKRAERCTKIATLIHNWQDNGSKESEMLPLYQFYIDLWEENNHIEEVARPFIYALMLGPNSSFASKSFAFKDPTANSPSILLHEDPFLIENIGSRDLAKILVQNAVKQILDKDAFYGEMVKNAIEAKATKIGIEVHTDQEDNLIMVVRDNGEGMTAEELKALKCPGPATSTKRKTVDQKNPNYGWGFFTAFIFDEIYVHTSKNNEISFLTFIKEPGQIRTRTAPSIPFKGAPGTVFILKMKKPTELGLELILYRSALISKCRDIKGVDISFNGKSINQYPSNERRLAQFRLPYNDSFVIAEIKKGSDGLYSNGIRIGDVDQRFTSQLPHYVRFALKEVGLTVTIPQEEQLRNRSALIDNSALMTVIQKTIFGVLLNYCQQKLVNNDNQRLGKEFWTDFDHTDFQLPSHLKPLLEVILHKFLIDQDTPLKLALLELLANYLEEYSRKNKEALFFPIQNCSGKELLSLLKSRVMGQWSAGLEDVIKNDSDFIYILIHLPINHNRAAIETIYTVREKMINSLIKKDILRKDRSYHMEKIKNEDLEDLNELIEDALNAIVIDNDLIDLDKFLSNFQKKIKEEVVTIRNQPTTVTQPIERTKSDLMINFFKKVASRYFKLDLQCELTHLERVTASADPIKNKLLLSDQSLFAKSFVEMIEKDPKKPDLMRTHYPIIKQALEIIVSKCSELQSKETIQNDFSDKALSLLVTDLSQPSVLDILDESLRSHKKRKIEMI